MVRRPIHVGFPALRAAAGSATEWRAISIGFESVWKYRYIELWLGGMPRLISNYETSDYSLQDISIY